MKKFRFSLATVLKVRRQEEESLSRELAKARAERDAALAGLGREKRSLDALLEEQVGERNGRIELAREAWFLARHRGLLAGIERLKSEAAEKESALEKARLAAVEASRKRQVLENLEEKQLEEHLLQASREEQALLDDRAQRAVSALSLEPKAAAHGAGADDSERR